MNEKQYIITGLVGGAILAAAGSGLGSLSAAAPSKQQQTAYTIGTYTFLTTLGYSVSRGIFKQNVKTSLIAGLVVAGAYYFYSNKKKAEYAQQKRKEEEDNLLLNTGVKAIPK
jgi:cbb3-type cytochrome oxidase subunit 3